MYTYFMMSTFFKFWFFVVLFKSVLMNKTTVHTVGVCKGTGDLWSKSLLLILGNYKTVCFFHPRPFQWNVLWLALPRSACRGQNAEVVSCLRLGSSTQPSISLTINLLIVKTLGVNNIFHWSLDGLRSLGHVLHSRHWGVLVSRYLCVGCLGMRRHGFGVCWRPGALVWYEPSSRAKLSQ